MRATSLERASCTYRASWQAIPCCDIQHRPVQRNGIAAAQYLVCHCMQCLVKADVHLLREYDEVAPEQSRHTGVHQRMRLIVDEQQRGIGHVLSNGWELFEFLPVSGPCKFSVDQFPCQPLQRRGTATPKADWSKVLGKFRQVAVGQSFPVRVFIQKTWQESCHRFCVSPLQEDLDDQANIWGSRHRSPRKLPPLQGKPGEQFTPEPGGPVARNRFSWGATRIHGKIARCGARRLLTHRVIP